MFTVLNNKISVLALQVSWSSTKAFNVKIAWMKSGRMTKALPPALRGVVVIKDASLDQRRAIQNA